LTGTPHTGGNNGVYKKYGSYFAFFDYLHYCSDQIETYDPQSGKMKYLPMYNHAYTDGRGNYFLRDYDDSTLPFDNASQWRKRKIINRNDPNYK